MTAPSIGRIVQYTLSEGDAYDIQNSRHSAGLGYNTARAGDVYPAIVVRGCAGPVPGGVSYNLQVFLDGHDTFWATSTVEGTEPGTWAWPTRV